MRCIVLAMATVCLVGCADQERQARYQALAEPCKAIPAERGSAVRHAECMNAAGTAAGFNNPAESLLQATRMSLAAGVDNGTITSADARLRFAETLYQVQRDETAQQAQRAATAAAILSSMPQPQPYVAQPYAVPVHQPWTATCSRIGSFTTCNGN
jgi:hypothetical protein